MGRFLHHCLIVLLTVAFAVGGARQCTAAKAQAGVPVDHSMQDHSLHGGQPMSAMSALHSTHANHDSSKPAAPQRGGCDHGDAKCCAACVPFSSAVSAARDTINLETSALIYPITDDQFSSDIVPIDPGIPKQAV